MGQYNNFQTFRQNVVFQFEKFQLKGMIGQEDCLVLNIYVPDRAGSLPVMVFIHGGGFFLGSGSNRFYGPERFMDHGVVRLTLTFSYHLSLDQCCLSEQNGVSERSELTPF